MLINKEDTLYYNILGWFLMAIGVTMAIKYTKDIVVFLSKKISNKKQQ